MISTTQVQDTFVQDQEGNKLIRRTIDTMLKDKLHDDIKEILLFGSYADNTYIYRSDIDICVVFKKKISEREATLFRIRISGALPDKMDIQVFHILPQKIKKEILKNHKVLYQSEK